MSMFVWRVLNTVCSGVHSAAFYLAVADSEGEDVKLVSLLLKMHHFKVKHLEELLKEQRSRTFFFLFCELVTIREVIYKIRRSLCLHL